MVSDTDNTDINVNDNTHDLEVLSSYLPKIDKRRVDPYQKKYDDISKKVKFNFNLISSLFVITLLIKKLKRVLLQIRFLLSIKSTMIKYNKFMMPIIMMLLLGE